MTQNATTSVSPAEAALGLNAVHARHNHAVGLISGGIAGVAMKFVQPELILAGLMYALTRSALLASLVVVVNKVGAMGPQLLVGSWLEHRDRRRPYFRVLAVLRPAVLGGLVLTMVALAQQTNALTLTLFYAIYLLFCLTSGTGHVIWLDMVGRLIPPDRLGKFMGARSFLGHGLGIVAAALLIQPILDGLPLPWNYVLLVAIGAVLVGVDMHIWGRCREEPGPAAERRVSFRQAMRRGFRWLAEDHNYRCYFLARVSFRLTYLGLALFIPYGQEVLPVRLRPGYAGDVQAVALLGGVLVAVRTASDSSGSLIWSRLVDALGVRFCLTCSGLLIFLAAVLALSAPSVPSVFSLSVPWTPLIIDLPIVLYMASLAALGMALTGTMLGTWKFVLTTSRPEERPAYLAFTNTISTPLTLLPLASAWVASQWGMATVFYVVLAGGAMQLLAASRMRLGDQDPAAGA